MAHPLPGVAGYVEAATADRLLGWAWSPSKPEERVAVEVLLGDAVVARCTADGLRSDLASAGIGDGRHAFDIQLPEEVRGRIAELRVVARRQDGAVLPIGAPPAAEPLSSQLERVLRCIESLAASQRLLHRNVQAILTGAGRPDSALEEPMTRLLTMQNNL